MKNIDIIKDVKKIDTIETNVNQAQLDITKNTTDITSIKTDLSVTENSKHSTVNGIKEFECGNGYVDNVAIEGQTLVNLWNNVSQVGTATATLTREGNYHVCTLTSKGSQLLNFSIMKDLSNIQTTIIIDNQSSTTIYLYKEDYTIISYIKKGVNVLTVNTSSLNGILVGAGGNASSGAVIKLSVMIIEGDHTQNPPSYFEGIKSIGQGDKIEILTYNSTPKISTTDNYIVGHVNKDTGVFYTDSPTARTVIIPCIPNTTYKIKKLTISSRTRLGIYSSYPVSGSVALKVIDVDSSINDILFYTPSNGNYIAFNPSNNSETPTIEISEYKTDKKQILTTVRSVSDSIKDIIYKQGDKYYKIKRCGEYTITGSETISLSFTKTNTLGFSFINLGNLIGAKLPSSSSISANTICDKFQNYNVDYTNNNDVEGFSIGYGGNGNINILKSKLITTQDLTGFRTWLASNPITIVYELATPIIEELPNFNPRTFSDKTTILLNTGVVPADASFEVTNSTRSELEILKGKSSEVEEGLLNNIYGFQKNKLTNDNSYCFNMEEKNINTLTQTGFYRIKNPSGLPSLGSVNWYHVLVFKQSESYCLQLAYAMTSTVSFTHYYRIMDNGAWQPWQKVATTSTLSLMEQQISELEIQAMENEV